MKVRSHVDRSRIESPRTFFPRELAPARLSRPNSKHWSSTICPFHKSKSGRSFAVNLDSGAFHCFGCDAHGASLIDFVMLRDHCDFKHAAQVLGIWRENVSELERAQIEHEEAERRRKREEDAAAAQQARRARLDVRDEVHELAALLRVAEEKLDRDPQERWWSVVAVLFEQLRRAELEYLQKSGFNEDDL
jgi:hypothetical protein